jgi:hypothetical protein
MADENEAEETEVDLDEGELEVEDDDEEFGDDDEVVAVAGIDEDDDDDAVVDADAAVAEDDDEGDDAAPRTTRKRPGGEEEEEEDDEDPDDVEADLDTILKDKIASGDDLDDEEEEEVPDRNDPDASDGVTAKKEGEFTCTNCFLIVHPRQFGRRDRPQCPEGYDPCPSEAIVRSMR